MQAPKRGTVLLLLALAIAVGAHAVQLPVQKDMSVQASDMCDTCLWLVNTTEIYLNSSDVKMDIINFLNTEVVGCHYGGDEGWCGLWLLMIMARR